jgi:hypothetical protein
MKIAVTVFILLLAFSSMSSDSYRDSELKKKDAPAFLIEATPKGSEIDDVEYFVKKYKSGKKVYELKYELDDTDEEVSISYSESGAFLEKEIDKKFSSLSSPVQDQIKSYLKKKYGDYKITETELRTNPQGSFIDVEVSHDGGKTGVTEVSFNPEGKYVSEEEEGITPIETLN